MISFSRSFRAGMPLVLVACAVIGRASDRVEPPPFPLEPTPAASSQMEASYRAYVECFNQRNVPCIARFYNDDLLFLSSALPRLSSKQEMLEFYSGVWKHLTEHLVIKSFAVEGKRMKVDLQNTLTVFADYPEFPPRPLKKGDQYTIGGVVTYVLRDGRIAKILDRVNE